ncbi:MAG TPA: tRNA preQ1(34) S-adenosylmethionine ribosyltransferase-isomerase QueA [Armatimonadota bacterium]|nr:tRNA preQ1(34) S-adenosylmethionine ribosyltransferase-isomerase QueA [Armatimonadota bacterium]
MMVSAAPARKLSDMVRAPRRCGLGTWAAGFPEPPRATSRPRLEGLPRRGANCSAVTGLRVDDFDYELPPDRIAQYPTQRREESRMLELDRQTGSVTHRRFTELPGLLRPGDALVLNDTRVIPARLIGEREGGGQAELLLLEPAGGGRWRALARPGRRLGPGRTISFGGGELVARVVQTAEGGVRVVELEHEGELMELLERLGRPPLPPYIRRQSEELDRERYQTVYARHPGAVAAPTAGLHFTPEILAAIEQAGVRVCRVTLHVGLGTFQPVKAERVEEHVMHAEHYDVPGEAAEAINSRQGRLVAVGTTVTRTLESVADETGLVRPGSGRSELFIYPGYRFRAVEAMLTNFHLPRSTLIMMVSAFAGRERIMAAYREALDQGYRFYSYGDCMFIH